MKVLRWVLKPELSAWDILGVFVASTIIENGYGIAAGVAYMVATVFIGKHLWDRVK